MTNNWFSVDKQGLAKLIQKRGKAPLIYELISNAWDAEGSTRVDVTLISTERGHAQLIVKDDAPDGFHDLAHAYTVFAESRKKSDPTKRGRFNLGEKLVLALADEAVIQSTTGSVAFLPDGTRERQRAKTKTGSAFIAKMRITKDEVAALEREVCRLLPPPGIVTTFNGKIIPAREPVAVIETTLPTIIADEEGNLTRTARKTTVRLFEVGPDETATVFEMGIPVVETHDRYHYDVDQKVPLTMDRENVPPAFLKQLRAATLNAVATKLDREAASEAWVTDALTSPNVEDKAVVAAVEARFGEKRAIFDPSDVEASHNLTAQGFNVVHGGSLPKAAWDAVKRTEALVPAGTLSPTPRPYSDDPKAPQVRVLASEDETGAMRALRDFVRDIVHFGSPKVFPDRDPEVRFVDTANAFSAAYGAGTLDFNVNNLRLGKAWARDASLPQVLDLVIHELAHMHAGNHLDEAFHKGATKIGAEIADQAFDKNRQAFSSFLAKRGGA